MTVPLSVVAVYLVVCLSLGIRAGRSASPDLGGFVAGDRSLGLLVTFFITGASVYSAFAFLGGPGWAYSRGAASYYILAYGALGMLPFYLLGPRAHRLGKAYGLLTQAELVGARFGHRGLTVTMAVVAVAAFVPYLAIQMQGAGYVLEVTSGGAIPAVWGAAGVYGVVMTYTLASGVLGVGWTNTFQGMFMMVLAWGLGIGLPIHMHGGIGPMFEHVQNAQPSLLRPPGLDANGAPWSWSEYGSAVFVSTVGFSAWPHLFMKTFSAKSEGTVRRTAILFPIFNIFLVPLLLIGFCAVGFAPPPERPDQVLPHLLMRSAAPGWLVGLFCAGALAASMSSGDAMAHAAGTSAVRDGLHPLGWAPASSSRQKTAVQVAIAAVMVVAYGVAMGYRGSLVALLLTTYGAVVQIAPVLAVTLCIPRMRAVVVWASLSAGIAVTVSFTAFPELRPWSVHPGLYGLAVQALVLGVGPRRPPGVCEPFLEVARGLHERSGPPGPRS